MKPNSIKKFLPKGPVLGITLIAVLLLAGVIYYRAVRIQRFLEPALAISQPRMELAQKIDSLLKKEFGTVIHRGITFTTDSIFVDSSLFSGNDLIYGKLGRVFLSILNDVDMRKYVDFILIITKSPFIADHELNKKMHAQMQHTAETILNSLYRAEPQLTDYVIYFAAVSVPVIIKDELGWVEFKIVPSEQLHIDVLQSLEKYVP